MEDERREGLIGRGVSWWVETARRWALFVVLFFVVVTGFLFYYSIHHLGINTDTSSMISASLDWRRNYLSYKEKFPQFFGEIVIVIDGASPDLADSARRRLAERLREDDRLFKSVYLPGGSSFFERNGLLYLDTAKLEDLADNLAAVQPFLGRLIEDQSIVGFTSMLESAMEEVGGGERFELAPVFDRFADALSAATENRFYRLSWQELMLGRRSKPSERRRFIVVQPRLDFTELFQGAAAMSRVRALAGELGLFPYNGVRVRMTGSVALANEEMKSVSRGAGVAGLLAFIAVCAILYVALRSVRLLLASIIALFSGIIGTAAFAAFAVGNLNLISMAFAVLYIGLGVDYAIHLSLRYRELVAEGRSHAAALKKAAGDVGASLVLCTITTSVGFYSFIPTAYSGVSELGIISGTGIFISLIVSLTLLPALITLMPLSPETTKPKVRRVRLPEVLIGMSGRYRRALFIVLPVAGLVGLFLLRGVRFDNNPMNLRDSTMESVSTFNELMEESDSSPLTINVLKPAGAPLKESAARLKKLGLVDKAVTIYDFIPGNQEEKLDIIEEMSLLLGPELEYEGVKKKQGLSEKIRALESLREGVETFVKSADRQEAASGRRLIEEIKRFTGRLEGSGIAASEAAVNGLEESLLAALPERLRVLRASLDAAPVTFKDLPGDLARRWVSPEGLYMIKVFPGENISDPARLKRFVREVRTVEPDATGLPVVILESGRAVVSAFKQAFVYALILITVILLVLLRRLTDTIFVLLPILFAGVLTGAATVLLGIPFNFANVIALPLFLGIGVDNGIHIVHRYRTAPPHEGSLFRTSTTRAVFYSAVTTIVSFGGLAFSRHRGMSSMGVLLTIGIILTVICTLGVLPVLLPHGEKDKAKGRG